MTLRLATVAMAAAADCSITRVAMDVCWVAVATVGRVCSEIVATVAMTAAEMIVAVAIAAVATAAVVVATADFLPACMHVAATVRTPAVALRLVSPPVPLRPVSRAVLLPLASPALLRLASPAAALPLLPAVLVTVRLWLSLRAVLCTTKLLRPLKLRRLAKLHRKFPLHLLVSNLLNSGRPTIKRGLAVAVSER